MNSPTKPYPAAREALKDYLRETWRLKYLTIPGLLLPGIGSTFIFYIPPLIIAAIIRDFQGHIPSTWNEVAPYVALLAGAWFIGELMWHVSFLLLQRAQSRIIGRLNVRAFEELTEKDLSFFNDNFAGSLTKKVTAYGSSYERFFDTFSFNIAGSYLPLMFALVILWFISPILVAILLSIMILVFFIVAPLIRRRMKLVRKREAENTRMTGHVADAISNISAVQAFAHEDFENKLHVDNIKRYTKAMYDAWDYDTKYIHRSVFPMNVLTNVAGLATALLISHNAATMAAVFVTFNYFAQACRIMFEFNNIYRSLESSVSAAAEFTLLRATLPTIVDAPGAKPLIVTKGEVAFENVRFGYPESAPELLFNPLHLTIPAGQKIALVGRSGGGKTTITNLLLRFIDVNDGVVTIDGQNIAACTKASLRQSIAYVPQDPAMFHRSITENIRYGNLHATDEEVLEAAHKAHALEFIEKLPEGFDTLVGERGVKLSGGQRQRIAIARAILKDAPILVLDEATSALDSESEKYIQDALNKLMKSRTSIVIAHRLSTIAKLDRIIVLDKGKIVEDGPHAKLLKQDGIYAKLWSHQSGGFIEE